MKRNLLIILILVISLAVGYLAFRLYWSTPKISYNFSNAPRSSGFALLNDNKLTGLKIYLGKTDSPKIPSLKLENKESSLELASSILGENSFKKVSPKPPTSPNSPNEFVTWQNFLPSLDLQYQLQDDGLRSEMVLKDNTLGVKAVKEHTLFTIPFYLTLNNAVPRSDIEGNLTPLFLDSKSGEYRFHLEKPIIRDANGAVSEVNWSLKALDDSTSTSLSANQQPETKDQRPKTNDQSIQYLLTLELPRAWLADKTRSYPVTMVSNIIRNAEKAFEK